MKRLLALLLNILAHLIRIGIYIMAAGILATFVNLLIFEETIP